MTTELEKQFFDTFGIKHEERYYNCKDNLEGKCGIKCPCECCDKSEEVYCYPQITDTILLELICLNNRYAKYFEEYIIPMYIKNLEKSVMGWLLIQVKDFPEIKHQVQAIFEGER